MLKKIQMIAFVTLQILSSSVFADNIMGGTGFESSLDRFNQYQSKQQCTPRLNTTCPSLLSDLVEDDFKDRALIIKSRAPICRKTLDLINKFGPLKIENSAVIQKQFAEGRFNYLGKFSHSVVSSCAKSNNTKSTDAVSKFYYYGARLNEGAAKLTQERAQIANLLNGTPPRCPSMDILATANQVCVQSQKCTNNLKMAEMTDSVNKDEELYNEVLDRIKTLPEKCDEIEICKKERAGLSSMLVGLFKRNPWFLDEDFKNKKNKLSTHDRLKKYLIKSDKNLSEMQNQIETAANCIHGVTSAKCDLDNMREVLSLMPEMPERFTRDKSENQLTNLLTVQSCLEEGALDRNRTGHIMNETYLNIGLTIGTLGIGALANSSRLLAMGNYARTGRLVSETLNLSFDLYAAAATIKETVAACDSNKMSFQFRNLTEKEVCHGGSSSLSASMRDNGSCLITGGFSVVSALVILPGGARLTKLLKESGYIKPTASEMAGAGSLAKKSTPDIPATLPNLPKSIKVESVAKPDGQKLLTYQFAEQLPDGTWVKNTRELPIDEISGGINANFPAGRELFEKIAQEKSGKSHLVFVDVGSLGAVNRTFKAGDEAGDRYLKSISDKIIENGEGKVTLARLGGDEFGLIIDETDPKKVKNILENIQKSIRLDLKGDAKMIFREEKMVRAQDYKDEADRLNKKYPDGVPDAEKTRIRARMDELAKIQQPDISIGSTQIGHSDNLTTLLERAEAQAKEMKIQTALKFGRSAEKYGSDAVPNARPDSMFRAKISEPSPSSSWHSVTEAEKTPDVSQLRDLTYKKKEELHRFSNSSIARYEDEIGRSSYRVERYYNDHVTGERKLVSAEIPTRGTTGLLDGVHPESQRLILDSIKASENSMLVMPKLESLRYLNYFESGTKAGDEMLEAVSETLKSNMRSTDLTFKLNGADFLWSTKNLSATDTAKIEEKLNRQIMQSPKVKKILDNERSAINAKIAEQTRVKNEQAVAKLKEKLKLIDEFKPSLGFRTITNKEAEKAGSFKEILKLFDEKFRSN